ncbi:vigilin-like, partial [Saccoglossus kowalevskii]|uniref:Vigilin-like n=1 Tax=Saccoglossus kowalevskii TaxID=10224 RepID=A0ABM0MKW2_SACKO
MNSDPTSNNTGSTEAVEMIPSPSTSKPVDEEAYQPTYAEAFPPLPASLEKSETTTSTVTTTSPRTTAEIVGHIAYPKMALRSSNVTQVFHVPLEERRYRDLTLEQRFGETGEQSNKICYDIMLKT